MKQRSAQAIVLYAMDLEEALGVEFPIEIASQAFLNDAPWQPTRRYLERLAATRDWGEVIVAANLGVRAGRGDPDPPRARHAGRGRQWGHGHAGTRPGRNAGVGMGAGMDRRPDAVLAVGRTVRRRSIEGTVSAWVNDWLPDAVEAGSGACAARGTDPGRHRGRAGDRARDRIRRRDSRGGRATGALLAGRIRARGRDGGHIGAGSAPSAPTPGEACVGSGRRCGRGIASSLSTRRRRNLRFRRNRHGQERRGRRGRADSRRARGHCPCTSNPPSGTSGPRIVW